MLKIAMAGKWHVHAEGYANDFNREPDAQVVCVWDDDEARGREWAGRLQVPFYASYAEMLKDSGCDAVCICSPTNMHRQLMIQAARAKKHIFTEKVMCLNVKDCDEAIREINENGVVFTISFPHRCFPQNLFIKQAIESGLIGKVTLFRVRNCHNGALAGWLPDYWYDPETTGGGAMMDLGLGDKLAAQRVAGHQHGGGEVSHFRAVMRSGYIGHMITSLIVCIHYKTKCA